MKIALAVLGLGLAVGLVPSAAPASTPAADVRLTRDTGGGYVSNYTTVTGQPYTDATLTECGRSRGRQNEPSLAIDPRNASVMVGSSNDYCGVYNDGVDSAGAPIPSGPIWLGYYRSTNGGSSFTSSLVPGYPGDTSPYAAQAHIRTASAGDPVLAWDNHGRLFAGSESSDDPAGSKKTLGDVWVATYQNPSGASSAVTSNDGKKFVRSEIVARGSSAPNLRGKFNDKTAIEVDRTGGSCDGTVYFAWSRFTNDHSNIYLSRSTDHGATWSHPALLTQRVNEVQVPEITVTGNGHVFVTWVATLGNKKTETDAVQYAKSADCGGTFAPARTVVTFEGYAHQDGGNRDCGDGGSACPSGYTFFRADTTPRAATDQNSSNENVYIVYDAANGPDVPTGSTYGMVAPGTGALSAAYYTVLNGATGAHTTPVTIDTPTKQHQLFPDIAVNGGTAHVLWWDSRKDTSCATATTCAAQPIGNTADRHVVQHALDTYAKAFPVSSGPSAAGSVRLSDVSTNPNFEQFSDRTVPFAGDYLWVDSVAGTTYGVWTDWRDTVAGNDSRESTVAGTPEPGEGADVKQCRTNGSGDTCPRDGGLDQNIYGDKVP
jgi:hypothetical protein